MVQVTVESHDDMESVAKIALDVWSERPRPGSIDVVVDPGGLAALGATGLPYRVVQTDIQAAVDDELIRLRDGTKGIAALGAFFEDFRPYAQVFEHLQALAEARPDLASIVNLGLSIEGRRIQGIHIGTTSDAPGVLLNGGQHAREWITVMVTTCIADTLINDHDTDPEIASLVGEVNFTIVPIVNPDGYNYTWISDRFWRKNRRGGFGVDLNRNWGLAWGGEGSSPDLDSGNYRGEFAFSEPETVTVRNLIETTPGLAHRLPRVRAACLVPLGDRVRAGPCERRPARPGVYDGRPHHRIPRVDLCPSSGGGPLPGGRKHGRLDVRDPRSVRIHHRTSAGRVSGRRLCKWIRPATRGDRPHV